MSPLTCLRSNTNDATRDADYRQNNVIFAEKISFFISLSDLIVEENKSVLVTHSIRYFFRHWTLGKPRAKCRCYRIEWVTCIDNTV